MYVRGSALLLALTISSCSGEIAEPTGSVPDVPEGHTPGEGEGRVPEEEEPSFIPQASDDRYSPLARVTNTEFRTAVEQVLALTEEEAAALSGITLAPEQESQGLFNAANQQSVSQLSLTTFAQLASTAADALTAGELEDARTRLECGDQTEAECARLFGERLMRSAYRETFDASDQERLTELLTETETLIGGEIESAALDPELDATKLFFLRMRIRSVAQLATLAPKFLLLVERGEVGEVADGEEEQERPLLPHEIANRLSFFLVGSPPDASLRAAEAELTSSTARLEYANAHLTNDASVNGIVNTLIGWLDIREDVDAAALRKLRAYLATWVRDARPFGDLYEGQVEVEHADETTSMEPFGVLGLRAVIASHTSSPTPSFINRGEFIVEKLLCGELPEDLPDAALPEDAVDPVDVFEVHATSPCATCHHVFDNYGAALQRFDVDSNLYDPSNDWLGSEFDLYPVGDVEGVVRDPATLGARMAASQQARRCMTELWYRNAVRRDLLPGAVDEEAIDELFEAWMASGDDSLVSLIRQIVVAEDFVTLRL